METFLLKYSWAPLLQWQAEYATSMVVYPHSWAKTPQIYIYGCVYTHLSNKKKNLCRSSLYIKEQNSKSLKQYTRSAHLENISDRQSLHLVHQILTEKNPTEEEYRVKGRAWEVLHMLLGCSEDWALWTCQFIPGLLTSAPRVGRCQGC